MGDFIEGESARSLGSGQDIVSLLDVIIGNGHWHAARREQSHFEAE
jgi:hypothetical protein